MPRIITHPLLPVRQQVGNTLQACVLCVHVCALRVLRVLCVYVCVVNYDWVCTRVCYMCVCIYMSTYP